VKLRATIVVTLFASLAVALLPSLYTYGSDGEAVYNGDEAIYAQMAREMIASHRWSELSFDGEELFPRPPAAVWVLAVAYRILGDALREPPLRITNALLCALAVALTMVLGTLLWSAWVGVVGGAIFAMSDLLVGYARVYESEPLLTCFLLLAAIGWAMRSRRGAIVFGLGLGGALLTKQVIGLLPLVLPLVDRIAARRRRESPPRNRMGIVLPVATLVALPWHVLMIARHGARFVDSYLVRSLAGRATTALHHVTPPWFYPLEMFRSEGWAHFLFFWIAVIVAFVVGLRRGRTPELLAGAWALGIVALYSVSRSRYDYYLLICYPAFALAAAWTLSLIPQARTAAAIGVIGLSALVHLPRNLVPLYGDDETRALLTAVRELAPGAPLYSVGYHPFSAKLYSDRPVRVFVDNERELAGAKLMHASGIPAPAILASPSSRVFDLAQRPAFLLIRRGRWEMFEGVARDRYRYVGEAAHLRLLYLP
jgi:4-amino-4-deoxy-L-arabinose transferase-like glycosyltransferase